MVAVGGVIEPGEGDGVELYNFNTLFANGFQVFLLQRPVVRQVAESIEKCAHFHTFFYLLGQQAKEGTGDGVVAEVEVLQMNVVACASDSFEQIGELVFAAHQ